MDQIDGEEDPESQRWLPCWGDMGCFCNTSRLQSNLQELPADDLREVTNYDEPIYKNADADQQDPQVHVDEGEEATLSKMVDG